MKISVIIPALNEERFLGQTLEAIRRAEADEVIVVDGGSSDRTRETAEGHGVRVIASPRGRAIQMNSGAEAAGGDVFLFLHADTRFPGDGIAAIRQALADPRVAGGAFTLKIDSIRASLRLIAASANLRSWLFRIPYGDQGIFVRQRVFREMGGFPPWPLMEDVEFCRRMKRYGRMVILPQPVITSSRRWEQEGVFFATFRNGVIVTLYFLGVSPFRLKQWYSDHR
ncbi:MAG: TIGR04283 family arsenosugar biosynthesis glycosyltransferase [Nitrospirae bacterium]|nr:TIGR04283 family arsenosugar biosynthesis glycosyltransferase [Nitrospirota bacterium]